MADQSKPGGKSKGESKHKAYGEREWAGSSLSGESGGPLRRKGWGSSVSWQEPLEAQWGSGSRGYGSQGSGRYHSFVQEERNDLNEGRKVTLVRKEKWERGRSPIQVTIKTQREDTPWLEREVTISKLNPPVKRWFKITIPNGKKYDKAWLLSTIQSKCSVPINPIEFHYQNNKAHFFVETAQAASALTALNNDIIDYDNCRIPIIINSSSPPYSVQNELKPAQVAQLKCILIKRYDSSQKSLDLNGLRSDPDLMDQKVDIVLNRKNFMSASVKIIEENMPELLSLNLSNNRLYRLDDFSEIVGKAPNLKILNLSGNELKSERELDKVKGLKLDELWLEGNPLCKAFADHSAYLSAIWQRFPKLLRLDGCELPPPIVFDVEMSTVLPSIKGSYFGSEPAKNTVIYFLQYYYSVYDTENRQALLDAYHEGACCSLSLSVSLQSPSQSNLNGYVKDNRNIQRQKDPSLRFRLLKHSHFSIVDFLSQLPKTQHDMNSFVVDVCAQTDKLLCFSVHGVFKEIDEKSKDTIRAFTRVFVAAPSKNNTRMSVVNDELFVRKATSEELRSAFDAGGPPPIPFCTSVHAIYQEQQHMLQSFSTQSGMNLEWSQKCVQDNYWNFAQAEQCFTQLKAEGKIPAEAFQKC